MNSLKFPRSMRSLSRALPIITVKREGRTHPFVSGRALRRLTEVEEDLYDWVGRWSIERLAWLRDGLADDIGSATTDIGSDLLVYARLAATMATNSLTASGPPVADYLVHAELRHRILNGGALTAMEVAEEYNLYDRRQNATRHIGDALIDFAARTDGVPRVTTIGPQNFRVRGFPAALVKAWHRHGGGAQLIEAERMRPRKQTTAHPYHTLDDDYAVDEQPF